MCFPIRNNVASSFLITLFSFTFGFRIDSTKVCAEFGGNWFQQKRLYSALFMSFVALFQNVDNKHFNVFNSPQLNYFCRWNLLQIFSELFFTSSRFLEGNRDFQRYLPFIWVLQISAFQLTLRGFLTFQSPERVALCPCSVNGQVLQSQ